MRSHSHQRGTSRGSPTPKTERAQTALTAVNERVRYKLSHHVVTLLKDIQGKISDKKTPTKGTNSECYMFSRSGTCKHGDRCRYEHAESSGPPAYPSSPTKRQRPDSPAQKSRDCYSFNDGYCRKGDQCAFVHNKNTMSGNTSRPQRAMPNQGIRDCVKAKRTGVCGDRHCPDYHGKFNDKNKSTCKYIQEGKLCQFQWGPTGCSFNHVAETRQDRRPEHRDEKNGRGSGRAERYRG